MGTARLKQRATHAAVRVRAAEQRDCGGLAELLEQLGYPCTEAQVAQRLADLSAREDHPVFVADLEASPDSPRAVGLLALEIGRLFHRDAPSAQITALVVDRRYRHRGVARALIAAAELAARRAGCPRVYVRSNRRRDDAHGFYRAAAFEETHLTFDKKL
jgi:GNAT superfamily N-acetyltransferase